MEKKKIIDLLTPKCNGYNLPFSTDVDLIADILCKNEKQQEKELLIKFADFIASDTANLNYSSKNWVEMYLKRQVTENDNS
jgi:hypothetical protein